MNPRWRTRASRRFVPRRSLGVVLLASGASGCDEMLPSPDDPVLDTSIACDERGCACQQLSGDCDGDPSNGCEVDLARTPSSCGACGHDCRGALCDHGKCAPLQLTSALGLDVALQGESLVVCGFLPFLIIPLDGSASYTTNFDQAGWPCDSQVGSGGESYSIVAIQGNTTELIHLPSVSAEAQADVLCQDISGSNIVVGVTDANVVMARSNGGQICRAPRGAPAASATCFDAGKAPALPATTSGKRAYYATPTGIALLHDDASAPESLAMPPDVGPLEGLFVSGGSLRFVDTCPESDPASPCLRLWATPEDGGEAPHLLGTIPRKIGAAVGLPIGFAADEAHLYLTDGASTGSLFRLSVSAEKILAMEEIASRIYPVNARLLLDHDALYWNDGAGVHRLVLPP